MGWRYKNDEERHKANLERRRLRRLDPEVRRKHLESTKASKAKQILRDPDLHKKQYRRNLEKNPRYNEYAKLNIYGLTIKEYDALEKSQNGLCAICDKPETTYLNGKLKKLAVDHDSRFPKSHRFLLCSNCNRALGLFRESPTILENAIAYVEYWRAING